MQTLDFLRIRFENDRIFKAYAQHPDMHMQSAVYTSGFSEPVQRNRKFLVREHQIKSDTITAILAQPADKHVLALNFANAMFPGGGYLLGGNAQEEALCRASLLYYTIRTARQYYHANRVHVLPDYTDSMIYSAHVPVIRDNAGHLLDSAMIRTCDFITCPAVNQRFARYFFSGKKRNQTMQHRIANIIMLAADLAPDILILGAFGCGMFGNRREIIYPMFEQMISLYIPDSMQIIFADPVTDNGN